MAVVDGEKIKMTETTLIILKPDAVQRRLVGRVISRFEDKGLKIIGMKMMLIDQKLAAQHYEAHKDKPFYDTLVHFITGKPVVVLAVQGEEAIAVSRKLIGILGLGAEPGTIRGDFGISTNYNVIHGSDSPESAKRELDLFFENEIWLGMLNGDS